MEKEKRKKFSVSFQLFRATKQTLKMGREAWDKLQGKQNQSQRILPRDQVTSLKLLEQVFSSLFPSGKGNQSQQHTACLTRDAGTVFVLCIGLVPWGTSRKPGCSCETVNVRSSQEHGVSGLQTG